MKKKSFTIFELICYIVAAVLGVVALYMTYENIAYISEYAAAYGATFADLGGQAIQSVLSAFVPYFTYAFVALGIGMIYRQVAAPKCAPVADAVIEAEEAIEEAPAVEVVEAIEAPAEEAQAEVIEAVEAEIVEAEVIGEAAEVVEAAEAPAAEQKED